ncbi:fluoride efflux transporter FluC [Antribacter gilvus]|uniref:fluoride efflux transporter FluC n=1 Tax=Antribacter gilvus TaxID=2304675 RepID=UPI000F79C0AD|nr:CrcB family protein [Antribacter gilvus]
MRQRTSAGRRPPHREPALIGLVAAGGAVGSVLRYAVALALPAGWLGAGWPAVGWPFATLVVNVVGAFALGWLLERLGRAGAETPRGRALRLTFGTGLLGGFTTYSAFALETWTLLDAGRGAGALGYVAATILVGTAACVAGVAAGARGGQR